MLGQRGCRCLSLKSYLNTLSGFFARALLHCPNGETPPLDSHRRSKAETVSIPELGDASVRSTVDLIEAESGRRQVAGSSLGQHALDGRRVRNVFEPHEDWPTGAGVQCTDGQARRSLATSARKLGYITLTFRSTAGRGLAARREGSLGRCSNKDGCRARSKARPPPKSMGIASKRWARYRRLCSSLPIRRRAHSSG